jgi:hypothetical protein
MLNCGLAGVFAWATIFHAKLLKHGSNNQHRPGRDDRDPEQDHRSERPNP